MTTLIDDGLLESCLEDPVSLPDLDELNIIDINNIDAVIEDPGYILDEVPITCKGDEEYTSSYKKPSFTLPVTFFDITNNVKLLKKCRPISIKIVDCDIYPWYYKRKKHFIKTEIKRDEDTIYEDSSDVIGTCHETRIITPTNSKRINLSPEQKAVVLRLKQEIVNQGCVNEIINYSIDNLDKDKDTLKSHEYLPLSNKTAIESQFDKNIEPHHLLAYKEIAQTIVRNIDYNELDKKIPKPIDNASIEDIKEKCVKFDEKVIERKKIQRENIPLPYTVRRQKKAKSKEVLVSCESNKICDKVMSSSNQVIPHYHCPMPNSNSICNYTGMAANYRHFQEPMTNDPRYHLHHRNQNEGYSGQERIVKCTSGIGERSCFNYNKDLCYNPPVNNLYDTNYQNINSDFHGSISDQAIHYPIYLRYQNAFHGASEHTSQTKGNHGNILRSFRRPNQVSPDSLSFPHCNIRKDIYDTSTSNPVYSLNNYVNYNVDQNPSRKTACDMPNVIQNNPLLSYLLNCNNQSEYYQYPLQHSCELRPKVVVGSAPYSSTGQGFWNPPKPQPQSPSYECHLASMQIAQDKKFHYRNSLRQTEDTNLLLTKDMSNLKNVPIDPPNVMITSLPISDLKHLDKPKKDIKFTNKYNGPPNVMITNLPISNLVHLDEPMKDLKEITNLSKGPSTVTITDLPILKLKHSDEPTKYIHNFKYMPISPPNVKITSVPQKSTNQDEPASCRNSDLKVLTKKNIKVDDQNIVSFSTETGKTTVDCADIKFNINDYSAPILPIPSFKKSLEIPSEIQYSTVDLRENNNVETYTNNDRSELRKYKEHRNIIRKRKFNEEKICNNTKRISLQEYKLRRSENAIRMM